MISPIAYGRTAALKAPSTDRSGVDPRLKPAAHEFEAMMMQELLTPLKHDPLFSSSHSGGIGLMSGDAAMSTWSGLGMQSLAKAISDAGGLGIATKIIQEVEAQARAGEQGAASSGQAAGTAGAKPEMPGDGKALQPGSGDLHPWSTVRRLP